MNIQKNEAGHVAVGELSRFKLYQRYVFPQILLIIATFSLLFWMSNLFDSAAASWSISLLFGMSALFIAFATGKRNVSSIASIIKDQQTQAKELQTQAKELHTQVTRFKAVLDGSQDAIFIKDLGYANKPWSTVLWLIFLEFLSSSSWEKEPENYFRPKPVQR